MRSYETSRTLFGTLEFLCWAAIVVGGIMLVLGISALADARDGIGPQAFLALPGFILPVAGLIGVVLVQTARAAVDTAELTGQILRVSRDQLEVSKQSLRQSEALEKGFEALKSSRPMEAPKADFATMQAAMAGSADAASGFSSARSVPPPATSPEAPSVEILDYSGRQIFRRAGKFLIDGKEFDALALAQGYIDGLKRPVAVALDQKAQE